MIHNRRPNMHPQDQVRNKIKELQLLATQEHKCFKTFVGRYRKEYQPPKQKVLQVFAPFTGFQLHLMAEAALRHNQEARSFSMDDEWNPFVKTLLQGKERMRHHFQFLDGLNPQGEMPWPALNQYPLDLFSSWLARWLLSEILVDSSSAAASFFHLSFVSAVCSAAAPLLWSSRCLFWIVSSHFRKLVVSPLLYSNAAYCASMLPLALTRELAILMLPPVSLTWCLHCPDACIFSIKPASGRCHSAAHHRYLCLQAVLPLSFLLPGLSCCCSLGEPAVLACCQYHLAASYMPLA